ncbi:hypothetical protein [Actinomadura chibensis]|uniref:Uncharacterized protein n=1 Tax=Actinomadura chibensis TaxID=392828 RepID=A0A5D0NYV5_9ACTN|nr:hypothetical protein [Actinomadura chibensis]TYB49319.1 hypothetical protein FXF69_09550 [Actinomadura chibensis]
MEADLPTELVIACSELVELAEPQRGAPLVRSTADDLSDIPLRRLVWRVLTPGETFTAPEVVERLSGIGVDVAAQKVSNALGYWFARGDLCRRRKGVYYYPISSASAPHQDEDEPGIEQTPGRLNMTDRDQGPAMSGPEVEANGESASGQEVTRRAG